MAKFTKEEFISGLKEMTILEVKELVDAMKEEFGVDPSAVAVAAAPVAAAVEEGPSHVTQSKKPRIKGLFGNIFPQIQKIPQERDFLSFSIS